MKYFKKACFDMYIDKNKEWMAYLIDTVEFYFQ